MSECDFNQEGFCVAEVKCNSAKGKLKVCTAKNEDLVEICEDCNQPVENCGCGVNWVLVEDKHGKLVAITPKDLGEGLKG